MDRNDKLNVLETGLQQTVEFADYAVLQILPVEADLEDEHSVRESVSKYHQPGTLMNTMFFAMKLGDNYPERAARFGFGHLPERWWKDILSNLRTHNTDVMLVARDNAGKLVVVVVGVLPDGLVYAEYLLDPKME